ncbi:NgoMIV family type II restriction endonuclease [Oceanicaulis sp. MMSF_3324]|uniref:NgoMIV family type II restriction endonuclease n=1 Tax=Oceanicaulis sp. MMSF_3324 TaxID=3046702 RepID=UPI00273D29A7|nr:NgoMIV family type II restriction endonuclease [Oceanicaulis sp. MMSF_3324]
MSIISIARSKFHNALFEKILTVSGEERIPSIADKDNKSSIQISQNLISKIGNPKSVKAKIKGQSAGAIFEDICANFLRETFPHLSAIRPGSFSVEKGGIISQFDQYGHLDEIDALIKNNEAVKAALGSDYLIKPDIIVSRFPEDDKTINMEENVVNDEVGKLSPIRSIYNTKRILHASISCKWTIRSDRAQNSRSEGLNLIRNRKGRLPGIAVITAEPLPTRIASIALGTGDLDCVYHIALQELKAATIATGLDDARDLLDLMIKGRRLRDIADLPLDLAI